MQFSNKKKALAAGMIAVGGLALVGVGTGAVFTDSVAAQQQINVGDLDVHVAPADGSQGWSDGKTVTFNTVGPTGSSFHTPAFNTIITNPGNVKADAIWVKASADLGPDAAASAAVRDKLQVTIMSQGQLVYGGSLNALIANGQQVIGALDLDGTDNFTTEYYVPAGQNSLDNSAEGGTVTPKITVEYVGSEASTHWP